MYKDHPAFRSPQGNKVKIWRYIDFTKFVSLLDRQELFFARADKLGDPFEGSYPTRNMQLRTEKHKEWIQTLSPPIQELLKARPKALSEFYRNLPKLIFVSSWHEGSLESAAMWRLYLKSDEGIAIQSTWPTQELL